MQKHYIWDKVIVSELYKIKTQPLFNMSWESKTEEL